VKSRSCGPSRIASENLLVPPSDGAIRAEARYKNERQRATGAPLALLASVLDGRSRLPKGAYFPSGEGSPGTRSPPPGGRRRCCSFIHDIRSL